MRKLIMIFAAMMVSFAALGQTLTPVPMDSAVRYGVLPNGLTYYIRHNEKPKGQCEFRIAQAVGAILEEDHQNGLAHFLEHMCFNGTEHFPGDMIDDYVERQGCTTNAYTSLDETVYQIYGVPTKREGILDSALLILRDWSCAVSLLDEEIDKERGVIREEWRTGNNADRRMFYNMAKMMAPGTQYAKRDVIGDTAVINNFTYQALRDYYHKWYGPDLQAIAIVGDIDVDKMEQKVIRMFSNVKPREGMTPRPRYGANDNERPDVGVYLDHEAQRQYVMVGYKYPVPSAEYRLSTDGYFETMLRDLYISALNQRFNELATNPDCNFLSMYVGYENALGETDAFMFYMTPKDGKEVEAYREMCREIERARRYGITESELEQAKAEGFSSLEKAFNERDNRYNENLVIACYEHYLTHNGRLLTTPEYDLKCAQAFYPQVKSAMLNEAFRPLISDRNMFIIGLGKDKKDANGAGCDECAMPTKEQLLSIYNESKNLDIEAPKEDVIDRPLVRKEPKAGRVVSRRPLDTFDATELTLSNGIKVVIKTTDFNSDQILMCAKSFGGTSYCDTKDLVNAEIATAVVEMNGVGTFNSVELQKVLAGKEVGIYPSINRFDEEMGGNSTVKDFETMLKLNYLYFTEPRQDDKMFATLRNMLMAEYASRDSDPETEFTDHVQKDLYENAERVIIWDTNMVKRIDQKRALAIYKERFENPADFTFYFTGNIDANDPATIALIEKWLGGMKTSKKFEGPRDDKMYYAKGGKYAYFKRNMQTKTASNYLFISGEGFEYNIQNIVKANILTRVLYRRYYESIREGEGGTYGVGVRSRMKPYPNPMLILYMVFDTDPDKQNHLLGIIYDEIETIIKNGPLESDMIKAKELLAEDQRAHLRENDFWNDYIFELYHFGNCNALEVLNVINNVTNKDIQEFLKKLYEQNNRVEVVMMPTR